MDLFCEIPCLVDGSNPLDGIVLCKTWFTKADNRYPSDVLQKFIDYNARQFEFLETTPEVIGDGERVGITFRTSRYVGAVPLRAPDTGKQIGDFVVAPRFENRDRFGDYIEILDLLGKAISPEVAGSLPLASGRNFRPPFYLEAVKFVVAVEKMLRKPWRKFECIEVVRTEPRGQINWRSYVALEPKAENRLRFPVRQNVLSEFHREFRQIRFVFDICAKELRSSHVPHRIRNGFRSRLEFIEQRLYLHKPIATESFAIKAADRPAVKACKEQANRILNREHAASTAWRVDFNDVFEKFVLHILETIAHSIGGKLTVNSRVHLDASKHTASDSRKPGPDAVLHTQELTAFIEAKYKSPLLNRGEGGDLRNEELESDLNQIIAYLSSAPAGRGIGVLCYPSDHVEVIKSLPRAPNKTPIGSLIIGIPLKRSAIPDTVTQIIREIDLIRVF